MPGQEDEGLRLGEEGQGGLQDLDEGIPQVQVLMQDDGGPLRTSAKGRNFEDYALPIRRAPERRR